MMSLRSRALSGEKLLGVLLRMPAEEVVEMVAVSGFDFVLIDCEHGPADLIPLRQHIAAAQPQGVDVLVRIGALRVRRVGPLDAPCAGGDDGSR